MSEQVVQAINSLQKSLGRINEEQTRALIKILAPLSQLPQIAETQARESVEAAYDVVRAQVLIAIAQQKGQLGARESQINEELREVERLRKAAEKRAEVLRENLKRQLEEISVNTAQLVEQMDRPVMDLGRRVFTEAVFLPYTEHVIPHWSLQVGVGIGSQEVRRLTLEHGYNEIRTRVEQYLTEVEELQAITNRLSSHKELPADLSVPICLVTYEEEGMEREHVYLAPAVGTEGEIVHSPLVWLHNMIKDNINKFRGHLLSQMREIMRLVAD